MSDAQERSRLTRGGSSFSLWLPVEPRGQERVRFTRGGRAYTPAKTRQATDEIRRLWEEAGSPVVGAEWFSAYVFASIPKPKTSKHPFPPRPDADNIAKLVMDALQGHAFPNDSRCWQITATKQWGITPGLTVVFSWRKSGGGPSPHGTAP